MTTPLLLIVILCFAPFFALGIFMMLTGKGAFLVAGFNTMPKEKQAKYNAKALTKAVGALMLLSMSSIIIIIIGIFTELVVVTILGIIFTIIVLVGGLIYINGSSRFKAGK